MVLQHSRGLPLAQICLVSVASELLDSRGSTAASVHGTSVPLPQREPG